MKVWTWTRKDWKEVAELLFWLIGFPAILILGMVLIFAIGSIRIP